VFHDTGSLSSFRSTQGTTSLPHVEPRLSSGGFDDFEHFLAASLSSVTHHCHSPPTSAMSDGSDNDCVSDDADESGVAYGDPFPSIPTPVSTTGPNKCDSCRDHRLLKECRRCDDSDHAGPLEFGLCVDCKAECEVIFDECLWCKSQARFDDSLICWECYQNVGLERCMHCTSISGMCKGCVLNYDDVRHDYVGDRACGGTPQIKHPGEQPCMDGSRLCAVCQYGAFQHYDSCWVCGQYPPAF